MGDKLCWVTNMMSHHLNSHLSIWPIAQICTAISELSSTLGDLETTFTKKMEQFMMERPDLGTHVSTLKEDLSGLIQALSAKLSATDQSEQEIESVIDDEVRVLSSHGPVTLVLLSPLHPLGMT